MLISICISGFASVSSFASSTTTSIHKINQGESPTSILIAHGFPASKAYELVSRSELPKDLPLIPGDNYLVTKSRKQIRSDVKIYDPSEDTAYLFSKNGEKYSATKKAQNFRVELEKLKGSVQGSLMAAIQSKVQHHWLAYRFMDAFHLDYNVARLLKRGAAFSLTFEKKYDGPHFIRFGEITHASLEINGQHHERHFVPLAGGGVFWGPDQDHTERPFFSPVEYLHISSLYQPRRLHPVKRRYQAHLGIDFALPEGEPVYTAAAGRVVRAGKRRGAGNYVVIRHKNGFETFYNHLLEIAPNVRSGVAIKNGDVIGKVGCTGYCTRPHLHFAVKRGGRFVNPISYLKGVPYQHQLVVEAHKATVGAR